MRVLVQHQSTYRYPKPASLGAHLLRLRPCAHARAHVETYSLRVSEPGQLRWQQDPAGNFVAQVTWPGARLTEMTVSVELAVDIRPVNPFDFTLERRAEKVPIDYGPLARDLSAYLDLSSPAFARGPRFEALSARAPRSGETVSLVVELNRLVREATKYIIREEPGIWTPEETLKEGRGSCRDSATLLVALLRSRGLAARFVSGYLVQLTDEGMIPNEPKGVSRDVVDLHAWAEVFLPGAGWIGLDATSGLLAGEGHIPLAATAVPALASPIDGTTDTLAEDVDFSMRIGRLGHEVRPTAPFTDRDWERLVDAGRATDTRLRDLGVNLTLGGEPTFNSRLHAERPEWNGDALGATKWEQGLALARELSSRLTPGGVLLLRQGKTYPGESLPRWTLELVGRKDGRGIWRDGGQAWPAQPGLADARDGALVPAAERLAEAIARNLGISGYSIPAFEDPWRFLQDEASLPVDVDPLGANLSDSEDRRRLARVLDRGLATPAGIVLPLARDGEVWKSERWRFRRERLYLIPGDSPIGLRLPLASLGGAPAVVVDEPPIEPPDPRSPEAAEAEARRVEQRLEHLVEKGKLSRDVVAQWLPPKKAPPKPPTFSVRTALTVEPRGGALCVFLPPVARAEDFLALVAAIDDARTEVDLPVLLEGYPPPSSPLLVRLSVAPDPGVLEVNLPPTRGFDEHRRSIEAVFDAALHVGLHSEKYLLDGRQAGSGGGNHITLGGPSALESPFVRDPRLLASLVTFTQHHPSLSFLFSGLFIGPTSQAPRVDEARHDALYELEIALRRAFSENPEKNPSPPWLGDWLFRNLLVDVTGNTHRAELCIDKLFDWRTPHGRQGLVELRAFEMPPHPRMVVAQAELMRALIAALATEPYERPLVRWGQSLHDKHLLPTWMWRDFEDVLDFLRARGLEHPVEVYRAFLELRCPVAGRLDAGDVMLEVRNALEPWHVLGEEPTATGTSRYVDSSVERIEVRAEGLVPERHLVLVNGVELPMRSTGKSGEFAAGVRFRAWAPPHSLQPHLGIHHPVRLDVVDRWARRSLGACAYHVWHPEGRAFDLPPLTRFEATARRAQRFTAEGALPWPVVPRGASIDAGRRDQPWTLDLRRFDLDRPMPRPELSEDALEP
ncbi:transglutaminase family protein [Myxococcota bacterium]|nr:transglutaminase family protein [Myxococcota bacterium]